MFPDGLEVRWVGLLR